MAQNVLQLERSREGLVWSRSAGADDKSFAECSALLQQRQFTCSALQNAEQEVCACGFPFIEHETCSFAVSPWLPFRCFPIR